MAVPTSLLLRNASILTMDPGRPRAEAVFVRGNRIVAVGSEADVAALADAGTHILDANGATVLPGFVESHIHLFAGADEMGHLSLLGVDVCSRALDVLVPIAPDLLPVTIGPLGLLRLVA